jgi:hypothetical protein
VGLVERRGSVGLMFARIGTRFNLDFSGEAIVFRRLFAINLYCDRTEQ